MEKLTEKETKVGIVSNQMCKRGQCELTHPPTQRELKIKEAKTPSHGQCREMGIFEGLNILISTFCVFADGVQGLSKVFH